jgi:hypothetical protein
MLDLVACCVSYNVHMGRVSNQFDVDSCTTRIML